MSEPLEILAPSLVADPAHVSARAERRATIALLVACVAWGGSFTWAANIMASVNRALHLPDEATLGVLLLQSWRFSLAGILWLAIFPGARSGWTFASLGRAALLAAPFTLAMIAQQAGLARTSAAVSAFLTGLNVLFVPLFLLFVKREIPHFSLWIGIAMAMLGTWLLAGGGPNGVGAGELLGLGASVLFSVHILMINLLLGRDTAARMVGGQFLLTGLACFGIALLIEPGSRSIDCLMLMPRLPGLWLELGLLVAVATIVAFGLMIFYQPAVDPTRATFIYLTEPIFAAGFAWIFAGKKLAPVAMAGAALMIAANSLVEWLSVRRAALQMTLSAGKEGRNCRFGFGSTLD